MTNEEYKVMDSAGVQDMLSDNDKLETVEEPKG